MADVAINADAANIPAINFAVQGSDPTAPGSGRCLLYIKSGGVYVRYNGGSATPVGGTPALAEGQLAVGDGSGNLSALAVGSEGQLVTADASGFATWADAPEGAGGGAWRVFLPSWLFTSSSGATPAHVVNASALGAGYTHQGMGANTGDTITWTVYLDAGTWAVTILHGKYNNCGIMDWTLAAGALGTIDGYSASQTFNYIETYTGVSVATAGEKALTCTINGKNASSSSYEYRVQAVALRRTA